MRSWMTEVAVLRHFFCACAPHNIDGGAAEPRLVAGAAGLRSSRPDQRMFAVFAFEEVGVNRRGERRIVELDRVIDPVVLRGAAPCGTDLDARDDHPEAGRLFAGGGRIAGARRALVSGPRGLDG